MLFCLGRLFGLALFAYDVLFFWRILSILRVGVAALGQIVHVAWESSPLAWKCAWGVRFLQVGHVRYSISAVGTYHHPYS